MKHVPFPFCRLYQLYLRDQALEISFPQTEQSYVLVERLPVCFVEKENTEKRRGRRSVIKSIAEVRIMLLESFCCIDNEMLKYELILFFFFSFFTLCLFRNTYESTLR